MCFSAPVSFAAAIFLVPTGLYALQRAWLSDRRWLGLAIFPLLFGIQQLIEGLLWLNLGGFYPEYTRDSALGFLFFVYLVWPVLVPLAARALEERPRQRKILLSIALVAGLLGGLLFVSLCLGDAELRVSVVQNSILYQHRPLFDWHWNDWIARTGYALVVTLPLLATNLPKLRLFGALIALSLILSAMYFDHAFTSVWCFFAAILSVYVLRLIQDNARQASPELTSAPSQVTQTSQP